MRNYNDTISLVKNGRGVYCIDTTIGCSSGISHTPGGCYGDCYAARIAKRYGHDFSKTVLRKFKNQQHKREIISQINNIKMPFVRIGCSGDPSENWEHCIDVLKVISRCNIEIVIITRHWQLLTDAQLQYLSTLNICINTSVSALDNTDLLNTCIEQYRRIKKYCKSVLRIVSCDFNLKNEIGVQLHLLQKTLFSNDSTLDTVFRPSKNNYFVKNEIINIKKQVFNGNKSLVSKFYKKTYVGKCGNCIEMCGVNIDTKIKYENKPGIIKQLQLL
jgi:hypothetical protein